VSGTAAGSANRGTTDRKTVRGMARCPGVEAWNMTVAGNMSVAMTDPDGCPQQ
jgi:hypothetical protein